MTMLLKRLPNVLAMVLVALQFCACSKQASQTTQPAKPPEAKNQTYRTLGGRSVISIVSSDELEIREGGQNIVCKYTEKDKKLRVVVNALGTTTAKYFNLTPQGLVGEQGEIYYEPASYDKLMAQIELNGQLLKAVETDNSQGIESLIRKGASVQTHDRRGSVLKIAIDGGLTNAVSTLLRSGALFEGGEISSAALAGRADLLELLLKSGANPNDNSAGGATPLMLAAGFGGGWGPPRTPEYDKIVSLLCEGKADLNLLDKNGNTALCLSLLAGHLEATKILVAAGADRNIGKGTGHDPFALAEGDDNKLDALRTAAEREERNKLMQQYRKLR